MMPHPKLQGGLYAITDGPRADLIEAAKAAMAGGARMLQYRDLGDDTPRQHSEASALVAAAADFNVPVIIDHDLALVRACGAAGVHLSSSDADPTTVRAELGPDAIIGVSCYGDLERARSMADKGVDYISFGAFHASPTKPHASRVSPELLREAARLGPAVVAIGGITPDNGTALIEAGADYLASISTLFGADDIRASAERFSALFHATRTTDS